MPELPEVETTRRGLEPHVVGKTVTSLVVRNRKLRLPVPQGLGRRLRGKRIQAIRRRAKYLLFDFEGVDGQLMVHLGMSGSVKIVPADAERRKHDHIDLVLEDGTTLRYHDPRRFGMWIWVPAPWEEHALLSHLGPEPLGHGFDGALLYARSRRRRAAVKTFLMDGRIVVGVGNIYAAEALFAAGIRPGRAAGRVTRKEFDRLAKEVRRILRLAIRNGGTTLQDFVGGDGEPGYFAQKLWVYGREGEPCLRCEGILKGKVLGQRASCYCPTCQK
ncbi:MAG: bifunctional DNA-formamidopyrimidine glycosylase/DNA-(apurinic or apyrimidinic site) lyase [Planctomycetota bacterium]